MKTLIINQSSVRAPRKFIEAWCHSVEREFLRRKLFPKSESNRELTMVFLNSAAAKKTNKQFRQKDYATDVLSFDSAEPGSWGELILCPQVLQRQAREHGLSYQEELGYMILHGFLHLLGYDHEQSTADAEKMFAIQDDVFAKLIATKN